MVHIISSEKRKKIKFLDKLFESVDKNRSNAKEQDIAIKKRAESIIDRIKNDIKISSEKKETIIDSGKNVCLTSNLDILKIISKPSQEDFEKIMKNIKANTGIDTWTVESEEIKKYQESLEKK